MPDFLDTNIILYSILTDDLRKAEKAIALLRSGDVISVQVLNEMISVLRGRKKWSWNDTKSVLQATKDILEICDLTLESQTLAVEIAGRFNYFIYDANIIASAKLADCTHLWSEDMQHGQVIEGVQIRNPFA